MQFNHVSVLFIKCESNFLSGNSIFHTRVENNLKNLGGLPVLKNSNSMTQGNVSFFFLLAQSPVPISTCREMELCGGCFLVTLMSITCVPFSEGEFKEAFSFHDFPSHNLGYQNEERSGFPTFLMVYSFK